MPVTTIKTNGIKGLAIFDFDGTLSIERKDKNIGLSEPIFRTVSLLRRYVASSKFKVYIVTGRESDHVNDIVKWVAKLGIRITSKSVKHRYSYKGNDIHPHKAWNLSNLVAKNKPNEVHIFDNDMEMLAIYKKYSKQWPSIKTRIFRVKAEEE